MSNETEFEFDLIFALPGKEIDMDAMLDALFEAGCDDGVIGLGAPGMIGIAFTRSGTDAELVITQSVASVLKALPKGAKLREVRPDLVSQGDVARRLQVSRQALQKRDMPPPSIGGLYRASELAVALEAHPGKVRDALENARAWFAAAPGAQKVNARMSLEG